MNRELLKLIANNIISENREPANFSFFNGLGGQVLFLFLYAYLYDDSNIRIKAEDKLCKSFDLINSSNSLSVNYCDGVTGLFYCVNCLQSLNLISTSEFEYDLDWDKIIYGKSLEFMQEGNYEYFYGYGGLLFYLNSRIKNNIVCKELIYNVLVEIRTRLFINDYCLVSKYTKKIDMGIAHGVSGLILILCKIANQGFFLNIIYDILSYTQRFFLQFLIQKDNQECRFPKYYINNHFFEKSRHGWCYGDLSCSIAMLNTSSVLNDSFGEKALEILKFTASKNLETEVSLPINMGLCHGKCGLAFIYQYLFDLTHDVLFLNTYKYWEVKLLEDLCKSVNIDASLLNGYSGVGLYLLSNDSHDVKNLLNDILLLK